MNYCTTSLHGSQNTQVNEFARKYTYNIHYLRSVNNFEWHRREHLSVNNLLFMIMPLALLAKQNSSQLLNELGSGTTLPSIYQAINGAIKAVAVAPISEGSRIIFRLFINSVVRDWFSLWSFVATVENKPGAHKKRYYGVRIFEAVGTSSPYKSIGKPACSLL